MFEFKMLIIFTVLAIVLPSNAKPAYQIPQAQAFGTAQAGNFGFSSGPVASRGFGQTFNYGSNVAGYNVPQYYQANPIALDFNIQTNAQPLNGISNGATDLEVWKTQTSLENSAVKSAVNSLGKEAQSEAEDIRVQTQRQEQLALYNLQNAERQHFAKSLLTSNPDFQYINVVQPNNPIDRQISLTEDVEAFKAEQKLENYAVQDSVGALVKDIKGEEEQLFNVERREEGLALKAMEIDRQLQIQAQMEEARQRNYAQVAERARTALYVKQQAEIQAVLRQRANQAAAINAASKRVAQIQAQEAQQLAAEKQRSTQIAEQQALLRYKSAQFNADQAATRLSASQIALQQASRFNTAQSNNYQTGLQF